MMRRRKNRFLRRNPQKEDMSLQITSMADIFTIILVFLLKSFSTGITNFAPKDITLPLATTSDEITEMLKVEIGRELIIVDDRPVTRLEQFEVLPTDAEADGTPRSLNAVLVEHKDRVEKANSTQGLEEGAPKLMIMADQNTPYGTLKAVLMAASNVGFGDFKLAVVDDK